MPIEVEAEHTGAIVAQRYSVYIYDWNNNPVNVRVIYIN
jgi:hypothetical protein